MGVEKLIFKYLQGKLSREEQKELDEWLKDEKNKKTFSRLVDKHRIMMKMERMEEYDWQKKNYGIFIVDFADQELAHKIYSTN